MSDINYFLDTSVLRPFLLGTKAFKSYFEEQFRNGHVYISLYVLMEFRRSFIKNVINFYFVLMLDTMETAGDAITFWSNKFKSSEEKAVLQLVSQIGGNYDLQDPKQKPAYAREIARYIKRLDSKLRPRKQFQYTGKNETRCNRALIGLTPMGTTDEEIMDKFRYFNHAFSDVNTCRSRCSVDVFFLDRYRQTVAEMFQYHEKLQSKSSKANRGFSKLVERLKNTIESGQDFSCSLCEAVGDIVIAFETSRHMILQHIDFSFDHICTVAKQPHQKHSSEQAYISGAAD